METLCLKSRVRTALVNLEEYGVWHIYDVSSICSLWLTLRGMK